ncbi:MAG: glycosyltransferase family 39 protein [Candidatus Shapirobacteria bacterium]
MLVLAFILRFWRVWEVPPALNWDEVSIGYNAYSILKTGRDEWGKIFPLHFRAFGEYKLPVQIYASIPGIWFFGLNEIGVRATPIVFGTLAVFLTYFLAQEIFKNKKVSLLSAFLLAVSPWHLQLSRASLESATAMCLTVGCLLFFLKGLKKEKWFILSAVLGGLAIYTYNAQRVFVPLFLLGLIFIFRRPILALKKRKTILLAGLIFGLFIFRLAPALFTPEAQSRFQLVSFVNDPGFVLRINEARGNLALPSPLPRLIHNKITHFLVIFGGNFLAHFSPSFLFLSGAGHHQHHVQGTGEMYFIELPFLLLGVWFLLKKQKKEAKAMFFLWIFLAAVPVAITFDSIPNALRNLVALPSYQLLAAYGFVSFFGLIKEKKITTGLVVLSVLIFGYQFLLYLNLYYEKYSLAYSRDWQYGYKQVLDYVAQNQDNYDRVIITRHYGEPHVFTLFWLTFDPGKYQNDESLVRYQDHDWVWVSGFDKYLFPDLGDSGSRVTDFKEKYADQGKTLIIGRPDDFSPTDPQLKKVSFLDGKDAFQISEF